MIINPITGETIASLCTKVILGGKNPCVVDCTSKTAEVAVAEEVPTVAFPLMVALVKVPTLVKLELTTLEASVVPVNVPAAAAGAAEDVQVKVPDPNEVNTCPEVPCVFG